MPSYAFAISNVRMYLRIGPKSRTNRRYSKTPENRTCLGKPGRMVTLAVLVHTLSARDDHVFRVIAVVFAPAFVSTFRQRVLAAATLQLVQPDWISTGITTIAQILAGSSRFTANRLINYAFSTKPYSILIGR